MADEAAIIEKTLSQEFCNFLLSRRMTIKNPAAYLDSFINIGEINNYNEQAVKKVTTLFNVLLFLLIFIAFLTFFALFITVSTLERADNIPIAIIFDAALAIYYYFLIKTGLRKKKLKNRYMGFRLTMGVIPVLQILKEEFDTNPGSEMDVDLSPVFNKLNKVNQISYHNGSEQTFIKTWFTFTSPLQAGGNIRITIVDKFRLRTYTKRSSCGNVKSKRKEKTTHFVKVELYLPESKAVVHQLEQKEADFKVKLLSEKNKSAIGVVGKFVNLDSGMDIVLPSA
ncbi:MAG: hypothetical protein ACM31E_03670, partial [Fibrobacterota bacterium]